MSRNVLAALALLISRAANAVRLIFIRSKVAVACSPSRTIPVNPRTNAAPPCATAKPKAVLRVCFAKFPKPRSFFSAGLVSAPTTAFNRVTVIAIAARS